MMVIADFNDVELFEEVASQSQADPMKYGDCYWRRPDGWITHAHADEHNMAALKQKGMVPLLEYGKFQVTPVLKVDKFRRLVVVEDVFHSPWDRILSLGGAKEFPLEQVIAHNWHRDCSYTIREEHPDKTFTGRVVHLVKNKRRYRDPVTNQRSFPQLDGVVVQDFTCRMCSQVFNYEHHLNAHRLINHAQDVQLEVTRQTVQIISQGLKNDESGGAVAQAISKLAEIVGQQQLILQALLDERGSAHPIISESPVADSDNTYEEIRDLTDEDIIDPTKAAEEDAGWENLPQQS